MTAAENKQTVAPAFDAWATGDIRPFLRLMTPEARWTVMGPPPWGRAYEGKADIIENLLTPLGAQLEGGSAALTAGRILADGDQVVVEAKGRAVTTGGAPYQNRYCMVLTLAEGRITDLVEYMDSALVERVLSAPATV